MQSFECCAQQNVNIKDSDDWWLDVEIKFMLISNRHVYIRFTEFHLAFHVVLLLV